MPWYARLLRRAFAIGAVAWSAALPLATLGASSAHPTAGVYLGALVVYLTGRALCHQIPARSFFLSGAQMPVCARCTGIYVGAAVVSAIAWLVDDGRGGLRAARTAIVAAVIPTAATLAYEWSTGHTPANWIRAVAGVPIGAVVAWIVHRAAPERSRG